MSMKMVVVCCALSGAAGMAAAAYNPAWDWQGNSRTLYFNFIGGQYDINNVIVFGGLQQVTLKDSFISAVNRWNAVQGNAACKWDLQFGPAQNGAPQINVMLGAKANGNAPVDENGIPRFNPPPSVESPFEDPAWGEIGGINGPGPYNGLAFFRRYMNGNIATSGDIIFSPVADWGLAGALAYDPVIASLHEIGHAMRLMDQIGTVIQGNPYIGTIMGASLKAGVHDANSDGLNLYNPSAGDINDILMSCQDCQIPAPAGAVVALGAVGFGVFRRRRAA
ncbi:MAG: hypothetical protein U0570_05990 [Phycisphaerales bacterium]